MLSSNASQGIAVNGHASRVWKEDVVCLLRTGNVLRGLKEICIARIISILIIQKDRHQPFDVGFYVFATKAQKSAGLWGKKQKS